MKTKLFLALAAAAAITISGCSKSETLETLKTPEIEVSNLSTTSFSFTWTAIPDATGYTYEVKAANQSTVTSGNSEKPANVEVTGLSMASTYTVSVQALGTGSFTNSEYATVTVTTLDNTIHFADMVLARRLLEMTEPKIDADGDGKITFEEAAVVKETQSRIRRETGEHSRLRNGHHRTGVLHIIGDIEPEIQQRKRHQAYRRHLDIESPHPRREPDFFHQSR